MKQSDQELIADYLEGNDRALLILVERYLKPVYRFVFYLTGSAQDAEDITQDAFIKTWSNLSKFRTTESFKTWLFAIARNCAIDWMRKKKTFVFSDFERAEGDNPLIENLADPKPLPEEMITHRETKEMLERILDTLPLFYREVLLLRYIEHLSFDEIGKVLKKPLDTVKSQHRRALIMLRQRLDAPK